MNITYTLTFPGCDDGQPVEEDIDFQIEAAITYEPAYTTGLPENCYPDSSECDITSIKVMSQHGIKDADILDALEKQVGTDTITNDLWADYMLDRASSAADAADYYRESREDR